MESATTTTQSSQKKSQIFDTVRQCVGAIASYVSSDKPLSRRYATSIQGRLEVWAKYSGATSREGLSLDDRLATLPGISRAILGLLSVILSQVKRASGQPDQPIDLSDEGRNGQGYTDNQPAGDIVKSWIAISKAISSLFRLAAAIRDSNNSDGDVEVPAHYCRPDDSYFEDIAKILVRRWFPHARQSLAAQLGHSIFIRRRKILYRQKHEEKLQYPRSSDETSQAGIEAAALSEQVGNLLRQADDGRSGQFQKPDMPVREVAPSLTQFSQFHTQSMIMKRTQTHTVITGKNQGLLVQDSEDLRYPEAPEVLDHQTPVFCPYCCQALTLSQLKNWRRHVDEDIKPFVCISEACQHPLRFFSYQSDWLQHLHECHGADWSQTVHMTTWFCNIEHDEQQEFTALNDYKKHLVKHGFEDIEQDVLIRHNQALGTRDMDICPLCEVAPERSGRRGHALFDHIAAHLKRIALMALPTDDADQSSEENTSDDLQSDQAVLHENSDLNATWSSRFGSKRVSLSDSTSDIQPSETIIHDGLVRQQHWDGKSEYYEEPTLEDTKAADLVLSGSLVGTANPVPSDTYYDEPWTPPFDSVIPPNFLLDDDNRSELSKTELWEVLGSSQDSESEMSQRAEKPEVDEVPDWISQLFNRQNIHQITSVYCGYQKEARSKEASTEHKFKCTLGCRWSHRTKSNWERHERSHYPPEIWICWHPDCLDKPSKTRVSFRKDLARRHYSDHHYDHDSQTLTDAQLEDSRVPLYDSKFPRKCVFQGCEATFSQWSERSKHMEMHLKNSDILIRERIEKFYATTEESETRSFIAAEDVVQLDTFRKHYVPKMSWDPDWQRIARGTTTAGSSTGATEGEIDDRHFNPDLSVIDSMLEHT